MIRLSQGDVMAALAVPTRAYGSTANYVPPMKNDFERMFDRSRNPFITEDRGDFELFVAWKDNNPVGRIVAAIHSASNFQHGTQRAQFGFFDCIDDEDVGRALLNAAEDWGRQRGMTEIAGNFNLTAMQQIGVMTDGFSERPYTDMVWNPPHIMRLLEVNGYRAEFPMTTFETDLTSLKPDSLVGPRQHEILSNTDYHFAKINRRHFHQRFAEARVVLNDGFAKNPMFVPVSEAEFAFQAGDMMWVIDPRISSVLHYRGRPVGVILIIPDLNPLVKASGAHVGLSFPWHFLKHRLYNRRAVLIYQSVVRDMHGLGLNGAMLFHVTTALKKAGYDQLGTTWIADVNVPSLRQMEKLGARPLHRLSLFFKSLMES